MRARVVRAGQSIALARARSDRSPDPGAGSPDPGPEGGSRQGAPRSPVRGDRPRTRGSERHRERTARGSRTCSSRDRAAAGLRCRRGPGEDRARDPARARGGDAGLRHRDPHAPRLAAAQSPPRLPAAASARRPSSARPPTASSSRSTCAPAISSPRDSPVVKILEPSQLWVRVYVPETRLGSVARARRSRSRWTRGPTARPSRPHRGDQRPRRVHAAQRPDPSTSAGTRSSASRSRSIPRPTSSRGWRRS